MTCYYHRSFAPNQRIAIVTALLTHEDHATRLHHHWLTGLHHRLTGLHHWLTWIHLWLALNWRIHWWLHRLCVCWVHLIVWCVHLWLRLLILLVLIIGLLQNGLCDERLCLLVTNLLVVAHNNNYYFRRIKMGFWGFGENLTNC